MRICLAIISIILLGSCDADFEEKALVYDDEHGSKEILTKDGINEVLRTLELVSYDELPNSYLDYSDPFRQHENKVKHRKWYVIEGEDIFKIIVGKFRIGYFLPRDKFYENNWNDLAAEKKQYWLVDERVLYWILELILELDANGFDKYGFKVRESYRHPRINTARGGASQSQHIEGKAVDLIIEDVNMDGTIDDLDKEIVLNILEGIVGNEGGMGLYPGTMTIHFDTRGYGARWDHQ